MVTREQIEQVVGPVGLGGETANASPGQHPKHYQPKTRVLLSADPSVRSAYLWHNQDKPSARSLRMPSNAANYAAILYSTLHDLDKEHFDCIAIEPPPESPEWDGIRDRLARATAT
jgi:L-threonylcarbamoyladenylate synthase